MIPDIDRQQFGGRVRELLRERHVTGREVARLLKIPEQQFSRYLHGTIPDATILLRIARWGNRSVDWLLTGQDSAYRLRSATQQKSRTRMRQEQDQLIEELQPLDNQTKADLLDLLRYADKGDRTKLLLQFYLHIVSELMALEVEERALPVQDRKAIALTQLVLRMCQTNLSVKDQEQLWLEFGLALPRKKDEQLEAPTVHLPKRLTTILDRLPDLRPSIETVRKLLSAVRSTHLKTNQLIQIVTELLLLSRHLSASQFKGITKSQPTYPHVHMFLLSRLQTATSRAYTDKEWAAFTDDMIGRIVGPLTK